RIRRAQGSTGQGKTVLGAILREILRHARRNAGVQCIGHERQICNTLDVQCNTGPAWTATTLGPAGPVAGGALQRTQEVENVLLLGVREPVEVLDDRVRLRGVAGEEAPAAMRADRLAQ